MAGRSTIAKSKLGCRAICTVMVLASLCVSCSDDTREAIAEAEQRVRNSGQPLTIEELEASFPEIPPERNVALIYQQVFRSGIGGQSAQKLVERANDMQSLPFPADLQADLSAYITKHSETLAALDRAAAMPDARFELYLGFEILDPRTPHHHYELWECARTEVVRGLLALSETRPEEFVRSQRSLFRLADSIAYEPCLLSQHSRISIHNTAVTALEKAVGLTSIPDPQLRALQDAYQQAENQDAMIGAFVGERVGIVWVLKLITEYEPPDPQNSVATMPPTYKPDKIERKAIDRERLAVLTAFEPFTESSNSSWPEPVRISKQLTDRFIAESETDKETLRLYLPLYFRAVEIFGRDTAMLRNAQAALAVERYRAETGELPDDIGQLVPDYLDAPIKDPFDGQPLRYKRLDRGYKVYSVYADLEDNDGRQAELSGYDEPDGDWVFEVRR